MPKMWAHVRNKVNLKDPTSLLDQVFLACNQRAAQVTDRIVMEKQKVFSKLNTCTVVKTEEKNPKTSLLAATTCKVTLKSANPDDAAVALRIRAASSRVISMLLRNLGYVFTRVELCIGGTLLDYVQAQSRGRLTDIEGSTWARQLCNGLDDLHSLGLLHREIKTHRIYCLPGMAR